MEATSHVIVDVVVFLVPAKLVFAVLTCQSSLIFKPKLVSSPHYYSRLCAAILIWPVQKRLLAEKIYLKARPRPLTTGLLTYFAYVIPSSNYYETTLAAKEAPRSTGNNVIQNRDPSVQKGLFTPVAYLLSFSNYSQKSDWPLQRCLWRRRFYRLKAGSRPPTSHLLILNFYLELLMSYSLVLIRYLHASRDSGVRQCHRPEITSHVGFPSAISCYYWTQVSCLLSTVHKFCACFRWSVMADYRFLPLHGVLDWQ